MKLKLSFLGRRLLLLCVASLILVGAAASIGALKGATTLPVSINGVTLQLEQVTTKEGLARGLMERTALPAGGGMLFDFKAAGRHSMWMRHTLISLDMWWLDEERRVVAVERDLPPDPCGLRDCQEQPASRSPAVVSRYVIEVAAGTTDRLGVAVGDVAYW